MFPTPTPLPEPSGDLPQIDLPSNVEITQEFSIWAVQMWNTINEAGDIFTYVQLGLLLLIIGFGLSWFIGWWRRT